MAELVPYPFERLISRVFRELEQNQSIFDLPVRKFVRGVGKDVSVDFHGRRASTVLGPAAGPQSQLAQNVVLSFLGGGRIFELKTVQIMDELEIPRPCIDAQTIGYNVEWSQELKLEQSLEEYVKASMLVDILVASGKLELEDLWINILPEGGTHSSHIHPHSVISGTTYVALPEGASALKLEDPRSARMMAAPPRRKDARDELKLFVYMRPEPGEVFLWESWLRHEVPLNLADDEERISVSFNYKWV